MIPPGTPEWVKARVGCLGASMMPTVMLPPNKDGSEKAAKVNLRKTLVAERMTGFAADHYVSPAMQHGLDWEDQAKLEYEAYSGNLVSPSGWIEHPTIAFAGATPDAFVNEDGLLEVKCPTTTTHLDWIMAGVVPPEYQPQMAFQILCTGRLWADFASFDPRVKIESRKLFVVRFRPTPEYLEEIEREARTFLFEVDALFERVTT